jgi:FdhD protein
MSGNGKYQPAIEVKVPVPAVAYSTPEQYLERQDDGLHFNRKPMVTEMVCPLLVNGEHWLTVLCSPTNLDYFAIGFLYNEGLIAGLDDLLEVKVAPPPENVIRVRLKNQELELPQRRTLTSGCGGGVTFVDLAVAREPLVSSFQIGAEQISRLMGQLMTTVAGDHLRVGGFHTAGLSDGRRFLITATDIGRHNTLDKVAGECLVRHISMEKMALFTTGRVSTEMLGKAARMQVPVVVTINSPTHLAFELARTWNITLVGYARGAKLHIYTGWERIGSKLSVIPQANVSRG